MSKSKKGLMCWLTKCEKSSREKGMVGFLIKKGIAKSKGVANFELIIIAVFFFIMSPLMFSLI
jgi:hypothetical protein